MGFQSWKTSDTDESVSNYDSLRGALPVYFILPDDTVVFEDRYAGYGEFGVYDFYAQVARFSLPEGVTKDMNDDDLRSAGIELYFAEKDDPRLRICGCLVKDLNLRFPKLAKHKAPWGSLKDSEMCPDQGFFY